jgi:hypothetical protein
MRFLILLALSAFYCVSMAAASGVPDREDSFSITIGQQKIGEYKVTYMPHDGGKTVTSRIDVTYKVGPLVLFDFHQYTIEEWDGDELMALTARTTSRGHEKTLTITRSGDSYLVNGEEFSGRLPLTALPSTYWNRRLVEKATTMISTEDGSPIDIIVTPLGRVGEADRFSLIGDVPLTLDFAGDRLIGLTMKVRGRDIVYTPDW